MNILLFAILAFGGLWLADREDRLYPEVPAEEFDRDEFRRLIESL